MSQDVRVVYLAGPYSVYKDREKAFQLHLKVARWLIGRGHSVYSPIVHGHVISRNVFYGGVEFNWWEDIEPRFIRAVDAVLFIYTPELWKSRGCQREALYALLMGKPIGLVISEEGDSIDELSPTRVVWLSPRRGDEDDG